MENVKTTPVFRNGRIEDTNCTNAESGEKVKRVCNGLRTCQLRVQDSEFGSHCPGVFKYLQVRFVCISDEGIRVRKCSANRPLK